MLKYLYACANVCAYIFMYMSICLCVYISIYL